jgi:hypothetical protein
VNAFLDGVFFFDFEPFFKEVIIDLRFDSDAFIAFFGRLLFPSDS